MTARLVKTAAAKCPYSQTRVVYQLYAVQVAPSYLLVENVVGFELSRTRARMLEVMQAAGYAIQVPLWRHTRITGSHVALRHSAIQLS